MPSADPAPPAPARPPSSPSTMAGRSAMAAADTARSARADRTFLHHHQLHRHARLPHRSEIRELARRGHVDRQPLLLASAAHGPLLVAAAARRVDAQPLDPQRDRRRRRPRRLGPGRRLRAAGRRSGGAGGHHAAVHVRADRRRPPRVRSDGWSAASPIQRWTTADTAAALAAGDWLPCARQAVVWNAKKMTKRLGGERYLQIRKALLRHGNDVQWGDTKT